jgi:hypothetical protein
MPPEASGSSPPTFPARNRQRERANQSRLGGAQLPAVGQRKFCEQAFGARRKDELHLAPVGTVARAPNPAVCFEAAAQFHGAVVADLEPLGQGTHRRFRSERPPFDCQQGLMLLRFNPGGPRSGLAKVQKPANLMPEVREGLVIDLSSRAPSHSTKYIVLRYKRPGRKETEPLQQLTPNTKGAEKGKSALPLRCFRRGRAPRDRKTRHPLDSLQTTSLPRPVNGQFDAVALIRLAR